MSRCSCSKSLVLRGIVLRILIEAITEDIYHVRAYTIVLVQSFTWGSVPRYKVMLSFCFKFFTREVMSHV